MSTMLKITPPDVRPPSRVIVPVDVDYSSGHAPFALLDAELDDEGARWRRRSTVLISIIAHVVAIVSLPFVVKLLPERAAAAPTVADVLSQKDLTYLELPETPPQQLPKTPSDVISDRDRTAASRNPSIDRKTLDELRDNRAPNPPGQPVPQPSQQPQQTPAGAAASSPPPQTANSQAKLETPPQSRFPTAGTFSNSRSAGSAIEEAMRASAAHPGGPAGSTGEQGLGPASPQTRLRSDYDVISDTMGVDFAPYLRRILHNIQENWYNIIPEEARAPLSKSGKVSIEFAIMKDGSIAGLRTVSPSGDIALDRAAIGGITGSNPFPPLPENFRGQYLALRVHFYYNPDRNDLR